MSGGPSEPGTDEDPLRRAVLEGDLDAVREALAQGSDPDLVIGDKRSRREVQRDIDPLGFTALHVAAYEDDAGLTALLLEAGASGTLPSRLGWLPMELAASWGSPGALRALLAGGVDPDAPSRFSGPLSLAAARGDVALVELLVEAGARRSIEHAITNACGSEGSAEVLRVLLEAGGRPTPCEPGSTTWSARVVGLYYRRWECVALLREYTEPTTLVDAAIDGDLARVEALLAAGADVGHRLDYDLNALLCAATMGHTAVVERLLDAGAEIDQGARVRGTPLLAALARGHLETADALVGRGASTEGLVAQLVGARGSAEAWDWALRHAEPGDLDRHLETAVSRVDPNAVEALLGRGADPNGRPGNPPLMHATWTGSVEIVQALLRAGADPRARDGDGRPLMHYVLQYDDVTLDCLDYTDYDRNSPVLRSEAVRLLLEAGAPLPWDED